MKPATISSRSCDFRKRNGRRCERRTLWNVSTANSADARRRQASLPGHDAVLLLLFGLLRSGHVKLRKIDGWEEIERVAKAA